MAGWYALAALLAASEPAFDDRSFDENSVKHLGTGIAAGTAAMGTCTTYLVLRHRVKGSKRWWNTGGCYALTVGLASVAYAYKEAIYDPRVHGSGEMGGRGRRDYVEGVGGAAAGALIFVPIAFW